MFDQNSFLFKYFFIFYILFYYEEISEPSLSVEWHGIKYLIIKILDPKKFSQKFMSEDTKQKNEHYYYNEKWSAMIIIKTTYYFFLASSRNVKRHLENGTIQLHEPKDHKVTWQFFDENFFEFFFLKIINVQNQQILLKL